MTIWAFISYSFLFIFLVYLAVTLTSTTKKIKQAGIRPDRNPLKVFPDKRVGLSSREFSAYLLEPVRKSKKED